MNKIDLKNYTRLFSFDGNVPYLFSYEFVKSADWLNYLSFCNQVSWISYMHNDSIPRANKEGLELYGNTDNYENFAKGLRNANEAVRSITDLIKSKEKITKEDILEFFEKVSVYRWHYTRTEFFFTDLAFEQKDSNPIIQKNFETFEQLKLDGRKFLNEILLLPNSCLNEVLNKASQELNMPVDELNLYSPVELSKIFEGFKISNEELDSRRNYVHYIYDGIFNEITGQTALDEIKNLNNVSTENIIKGRIAHKGKITAKARVIKIDIKDYDKVHKFVEEMEQGEVLVAETTEPSIIMACKKASAIVTNQGGMMSHAAIVSREMKIPCIVGTGNATSVIKTGNLIEVDADNGMVKIIG